MSQETTSSSNPRSPAQPPSTGLPSPTRDGREAPQDHLLTVALITLNEADRLPRALASLPPGCAVVVVDSGSTDGTPDIARAYGATVRERRFDNFAAQKNAALDLATTPWVLSLDADEELDEALHRALSAPAWLMEAPASAYRIRRRLVFQGREMRFGKTSDRPVRLVRREKARFVGAIHERLEVDGEVVTLRRGGLRHASYRDLTDYFRTFNRYTSQIAAQHLESGKPAPPTWRLCLRPLVDFVGRYVLRGGWLDGYPGFCYALLSSVYGFVKYAKLRERYEAATDV